MSVTNLFPLVLVPVHDNYFRVLQSTVFAERVVNIVQIDRNVLHVSSTHKHENTLL